MQLLLGEVLNYCLVNGTPFIYRDIQDRQDKVNGFDLGLTSRISCVSLLNGIVKIDYGTGIYFSLMSRRRLFSKENTFWAFFSQMLDADGGCKEVIRKLQAYASIKGVSIPSSSTSSYCSARKKLDEKMLADILEHTAVELEKMPESGLLNNRNVIVVDGTGISMPDTVTNQETWPPPCHQY